MYISVCVYEYIHKNMYIFVSTGATQSSKEIITHTQTSTRTQHRSINMHTYVYIYTHIYTYIYMYM